MKSVPLGHSSRELLVPLLQLRLAASHQRQAGAVLLPAELRTSWPQDSGEQGTRPPAEALPTDSLCEALFLPFLCSTSLFITRPANGTGSGGVEKREGQDQAS